MTKSDLIVRKNSQREEVAAIEIIEDPAAYNNGAVFELDTRTGSEPKQFLVLIDGAAMLYDEDDSDLRFASEVDYAWEDIYATDLPTAVIVFAIRY